MPRNYLCGNLQQKVEEQCSQGIARENGGYVYASPQMESVVLTVQMKGMSLEQESNIAPDHALFS